MKGLNKDIEKEKREILDQLKNLMGWDEAKAILWLTTPNPHLGLAIPYELLLMGRGQKVRKFVESAIENNKPG